VHDRDSLSSTLEDYLETISRLDAEKGAVRVRDIAEAMSVHKSTVTAALKSLSEKRLVNYSPYEVSTLTPEGRRVAEEIARRHEVIRRFLVEILLVEKDVAEENACRMEHVVDKDVLRRLSLFAEFVKECPRAGEDWLQMFRQYYRHDGHVEKDDVRLERWVREFRENIRQDRRRERLREQPT